MEACKEGTIESVKALVLHGADVNTGNDYGETPLMYAHSKDIAGFLVSKGAKLEARDNGGETALHHAARHGYADVVEFLAGLLVSKGAKLEVRDNDGETALHHAASHHHADVVEFLISQNFKVNEQNREGETPLYLAIDGLSEDTKNTIDILLSHKADINQKNSKGKSPLSKAVIAYEDAAEYLLSRGAEVNTKDYRGMTPLLWAICGGRSEIAELLIAHGADVNLGDNNGKRPLAYAKSEDIENKFTIITLLKLHGAKE
jgi:ankyrin repeat protein